MKRTTIFILIKDKVMLRSFSDNKFVPSALKQMGNIQVLGTYRIAEQLRLLSAFCYGQSGQGLHFWHTKSTEVGDYQEIDLELCLIHQSGRLKEVLVHMC